MSSIRRIRCSVSPPGYETPGVARCSGRRSCCPSECMPADFSVALRSGVILPIADLSTMVAREKRSIDLNPLPCIEKCLARERAAMVRIIASLQDVSATSATRGRREAARSRCAFISDPVAASVSPARTR